jgi:predicted transcriptional regulator
MDYTSTQPTKVKIHCTDKDQWIEADIVNQSQKNIVMAIQKTVRLSFIQHPRKPKTWIANKGGYEFVYKETNE